MLQYKWTSMKSAWFLPIIVVLGAAIAYGAFFWKQSTLISAPTTPTPTNAQAVASDKQTKIKSDMVTYFQGIKGYYVSPNEAVPPKNGYPGVVMIHEWWGLTDQMKSMADTLAKEGYQVIAVDLFKGSIAKTADEARTQTAALNQEEAILNLKAAVAYLRKQDAPKIASLGWCFGGGQSLQLALSGEKLDATVIYYGTLVTDQSKLRTITWPILGIFGEKDTSIPPSRVHEFENALKALNIEESITIYPGVGHAFANPTGQNYAPDETKDAWTKTLLFLDGNLKEQT